MHHRAKPPQRTPRNPRLFKRAATALPGSSQTAPVAPSSAVKPLLVVLLYRTTRANRTGPRPQPIFLCPRYRIAHTRCVRDSNLQDSYLAGARDMLHITLLEYRAVVLRRDAPWARVISPATNAICLSLGGECFCCAGAASVGGPGVPPWRRSSYWAPLTAARILSS